MPIHFSSTSLAPSACSVQLIFQAHPYSKYPLFLADMCINLKLFGNGRQQRVHHTLHYCSSISLGRYSSVFLTQWTSSIPATTTPIFFLATAFDSKGFLFSFSSLFDYFFQWQRKPVATAGVVDITTKLM